MKKSAIISALLLAIFGLTSLVSAQQSERHMMSDGWWSGWFFGPIMMIFYFAIFIAVIVFIVRAIGRGNQSSTNLPADPSQKDAIDVLKERLAKGEINKVEFEETLKILKE
jgi:putative membrane protein